MASGEIEPRNSQMNKMIIPLFPKKGDLELTKNYRGITLTSIGPRSTMLYKATALNSKLRRIRKYQNGFRRNRSTISQILTIRRILEGVSAKNLKETIIFVDISKAFDSIYRGKIEQILLAYGLSPKNVAVRIMLHKNTKV